MPIAYSICWVIRTCQGANWTFAQLPQKCVMDAAQHRAAGRIGYGKKTIINDYGECEIAVPRDRNGEFEPKVIEKRQTRTDEIEQKIMQITYAG